MEIKTFDELAKEHLSNVYACKDFEFKEVDPLSKRLEFIQKLSQLSEFGYMYDLDLPDILLTGISGFEDSMEDPISSTTILMAEPTMNNGMILKSLPVLIPPFSTRLFENKDAYWSVKFEDMAPETDSAEWLKLLNKEWDEFSFGNPPMFANMMFQAMRDLDSRTPGVFLGFLKSAFVTSFYEAMGQKNRIDSEEFWDIFGWTLDCWGDEVLVDVEDEEQIRDLPFIDERENLELYDEGSSREDIDRLMEAAYREEFD